MNKDLRHFISFLLENHPNQIVDVNEKISRRFELPVIQQKLAKEHRFPVVYSSKVQDSEFPVVSNLFASYDLLALALGVHDKKDVLKEYIAREENPISTKQVEPEKAPVKEIILKGDKIDLNRLPIVHHALKDSGPYITIGCMVCKDPDSGTPNVGIYRHELKAYNKLGCMINPSHNAAYIYRRYQELNRPMDVAIFIGHHPAVIIGASSSGPLNSHNEFETMGALLGEPLEIVKGETVDLEVPAWAEMVIEGIIQPGNTETDGPFAEYAGYYGDRKTVPIIDVTAITMRKNAIYHDLDPAHREHNLAGVLCLESVVYRRAQATVPTVLDVHLPPSGCCFYNLYISLKKRVEGEAKLAALAALGSNANLKHVIVVDEDVDVNNEEEVLWALATRFEADQDVIIIPNTLGAHLDPSSYGESRFNHGSMTTKVIFDATRPIHLPFAERIVPPQDVWGKIDLSTYLKRH